MADTDIKCTVCGKPPSYDCREHFVRDLAVAESRATDAEARAREVEQEREQICRTHSRETKRADAAEVATGQVRAAYETALADIATERVARERAEAQAAAMRAFVQSLADKTCKSHPVGECPAPDERSLRAPARALLATDAGRDVLAETEQLRATVATLTEQRDAAQARVRELTDALTDAASHVESAAQVIAGMDDDIDGETVDALERVAEWRVLLARTVEPATGKDTP